MIDEKKKKKPFWQGAFSKAGAAEEAQSYAKLSFLNKSKNLLIIFFLFVCAISIGLAYLNLIEGSTLIEIIIGVTVYLIWLPFIYFNHRWAMIAICVMYAIDKVFTMAQAPGAGVSSIIFFLLAFSLTYKSFMVATYLKDLRKSDVEPSTFS